MQRPAEETEEEKVDDEERGDVVVPAGRLKRTTRIGRNAMS